MTPAPLLALALAGGCTSPAGPTFGTGETSIPDAYRNGWYQDWFTPTWETCGQPDAFIPYDPMYPWEDWDVELEHLISEECLEAVWTDMKVDMDHLDENTQAPQAFAESLAMYGYFILAVPAGTVEELRQRYDDGEDYLGQPFVEEIEVLARLTGEDRVRALVYNLVMSSMVRTVWINPDDWDDDPPVAWAEIEQREIHMVTRSHYGWPYLAAVLVHEATHLWRQQRHVICLPGSARPGERSCDDTWQGAQGYEATYAESVLPYLRWYEAPETAEWHADDLEFSIEWSLPYIHTECCADELAARE